MSHWYLFWLGVATGTALLPITAYLSLGPRWLRWCLVASSLFVVSRYLTMALVAASQHQAAWWALGRCWFATSVGLTFPSLVALDQLVRHPAMSPKKVLWWYAPFLASFAIVLLFGDIEVAPDARVGARLAFVGAWALALAIIQGLFVMGFVGVAGGLIQRLPNRRIQLALLGLMGALGCLGLDGLLVALGRWHMQVSLGSEILALVAIWFALDTARTHPL